MENEQPVLHIKEEIQDDGESFPCTELQDAANLFLHCEMCDIEFNSSSEFGTHVTEVHNNEKLDEHHHKIGQEQGLKMGRNPNRLLWNDEQAERDITQIDSGVSCRIKVPEQNPDTNGRDQLLCTNQLSKIDILEIDWNEMNDKMESIHGVTISPSSGEQQKTDNNNKCFSVCFKSFPTKSTMDAHKIPARHATTATEPCGICGKMLKTLGTLKQHLKRHSDKRAYDCEKCGKRFQDQCDFIRHKRSRTGENPAKCPKCEELFCNHKFLDLHLENHYRIISIVGDKPYYKCSECGKCFITLHLLNCHVRLHIPPAVKHPHKGERAYCCPYCKRCFTAKSPLDVHILKTHAEELDVDSPLAIASVSCETCGKLFRYKGHLNMHQKVHKGKETYRYSCDRCGLKFAEKYPLEKHKKKKAIKCPKCEKLFCNRHLYARHIADHDIGSIGDDGMPKEQNVDSKLGDCEKVAQKIFICSKYFKGFKNLTELKGHEVTHVHRRRYSCPKCGVSFYGKKIMESHLKTHSPEVGVQQPSATASSTCHICGKSFIKVHSLRQHWKIHHGESAYNCSCDQCGEKFQIKHDLDQHNEYRTGENAIKCPKCDEVFCNEKLQALHVCIHYQKETVVDNDQSKKEGIDNEFMRDKKYFCSTCGRGFRDWASLKQHKLSHACLLPCHVSHKYFPTKSTMEAHKISTHARRATIAPEPCDICGKMFKTLGTLRNHLKFHNDKRAYTCEKCGKNFQDQCDFVRHKRSRSGENPAKCPKCYKLFCNHKLLDSHLENHYRIISMIGDKPYCKRSECGKCFNELHLLNSHIRRHIDPAVTHHACTKCTKTFRDKYALTRHLGTHIMGVTPYSCYKCGASFSGKCALTQHFERYACERSYSVQTVGSSSVTTDKTDLTSNVLYPEMQPETLKGGFLENEL